MSATQIEAASSALLSPQNRVGRFSYDTVAGMWNWDDEVFRILALPPWSVTPTAEYFLSRTHPEDRAAVSDALVAAERDGQPFSVSCRVTAADGAERKVLIVCLAGACRADEPTSAIDGHLIDLTADFRKDGELVARQAVLESARHRATIERAVGGLMVAYGLDADRAFDMLRWWSQNSNVKVRVLAGRLVEASSRGAASGQAVRETFDELLHDVSAPRAAD